MTAESPAPRYRTLSFGSQHGPPVGLFRARRCQVPLYEVMDDGLKRRPPAAFAALGMYEKADLQRLLRDDISALDEDLFVIAEEFGNWEDARRRIDLLALSAARTLVSQGHLAPQASGRALGRWRSCPCPAGHGPRQGVSARAPERPTGPQGPPRSCAVSP